MESEHPNDFGKIPNVESTAVYFRETRTIQTLQNNEKIKMT